MFANRSRFPLRSLLLAALAAPFLVATLPRQDAVAEKAAPCEGIPGGFCCECSHGVWPCRTIFHSGAMECTTSECNSDECLIL